MKYKFVNCLLYSPLIIVTLGLLSACETVIEIDPPYYDSELNIISKFSQDSVWSARVMRTIPIGNDSDARDFFLADATVMIYQGDVLIDQLINDGADDGWYASSSGRVPELETSYRIVVEAPGFTSVSAESMAPPSPKLTGVSIKEITDSDFPWLEDSGYNISFGIENPSGLNYFNFSVYAGTLEDASLGFANYSLISLGLRYDTRKWYCNYSDVLNPIAADGESGDGTSFCRIAVFSDRSFDNQATHQFEIESYPVFFFFDPQDEMMDQWTHIVLVVQSLSPEYVEYSGSLETQSDSEGFEEPSNLYSNIDGGHGIFAGYSVSYWIADLSTIESE